MKTQIRIGVKSAIVALLLFLSIDSFSQPDYNFKNPTLIAGSDRQIGAKYRFRNVRPGTDGIITIKDIKRISLSNIDGGSGFDEAFQPVIDVPRRTNGYIEFQLDFVNANGNTPKVMTQVPLTAIDIDGYIYPDEKVYEYDEFLLSPSYYVHYDFVGSSLDVKFQGSWVQALNKTAVDYPGVDTVQRDVMFSMVHGSVSTITFRVGANNKSRNDVERLRSVYFKRFNYGNPILAQTPVINFNGRKEKNAVVLNWEFVNTKGIKEYSVERSVNGRDFTSINTASINQDDSRSSFNYTDMSATGSVYAYRLKATTHDGKTTYSQTIFFKEKTNGDEMTVYPNVIQSNASAQVNSSTAVQSNLQVVDYAGRVMIKKSVQLTKGTNSIQLDVAGKLSKGNYLVVLPVNGTILSQKIVVQ